MKELREKQATNTWSGAWGQVRTLAVKYPCKPPYKLPCGRPSCTSPCSPPPCTNSCTPHTRIQSTLPTLVILPNLITTQTQVSNPPPFSATGDRFDMGSFAGRALHFFNVLGDFRTVWASDALLHSNLALLESHKKGEVCNTFVTLL
jgi:hypothetical protein